MEIERVAPPELGRRITSIDALRGFDMFWITGSDAFIHSLGRVIHHPTMTALDRQFKHVEWQGFHFFDLIFPLFIVGVVLPFSLNRRLESEASRAPLYGHAFRRFAILFFLGLIYNGLLNLRFDQLRVAGVLQRIAVCYLLATLVVMNTSIRGQALVAGGLVFGYWMVMKLIPVPGFGAGELSSTGNLASYIDRHLLPRPLYCFGGGNLSTLSTLPAVSTTLIGVLTGHWLRSRQSPGRKVGGMILAGVASLLVGLIRGHWFPIIKNLWTSSYVLFAAGWSLLLLALFYWIIDVRGYKRWAFFFMVIGLNPITIYVVQRLFNFGTIASIFVHGFIDLLGPIKPVFWEASVLLVSWLFLWFLYRQKIFLKV